MHRYFTVSVKLRNSLSSKLNKRNTQSPMIIQVNAMKGKHQGQCTKERNVGRTAQTALLSECI